MVGMKAWRPPADLRGEVKAFGWEVIDQQDAPQTGSSVAILIAHGLRGGVARSRLRRSREGHLSALYSVEGNILTNDYPRRLLMLGLLHDIHRRGPPVSMSFNKGALGSAGTIWATWHPEKAGGRPNPAPPSTWLDLDVEDIVRMARESAGPTKLAPR